MKVRSNSIACLVLAASLGAGCQLLVTFETIDEGGGGTGGAATTANGGSTATGGSTTTTTFTDPPMCMSAPECDDFNPCTADDCASAECVHNPTNEGVAQADVDLEDCKVPVCQGGVIVDVADANQLPDPDPNGCGTWSCNGTEPTSMPVNEGGLCGQQPADPCKKTVCSGGVCMMADAPDGTVVDPGDVNLPTGTGDCRDLVCEGGVGVLKPNFLNCADVTPGNCNIRPCGQDGICGSLQLAPAGTPCDSNGDGSWDAACGADSDGTTCP